MNVSREAIISDVSRETLHAFLDEVVTENEVQNLFARGGVDDLWVRHIEDSLQLLNLLRPGSLADVGSGAGFPGMVLAIAEPDREVVLIEPRKRRVAFLKRAAEKFAPNVSVSGDRAEQVTGTFSNITARALADLGTTLRITSHLADSRTRWVLPKGRSAHDELKRLEGWRGSFRIVPSLTEPASGIIVADEVRAT